MMRYRQADRNLLTEAPFTDAHTFRKTARILGMLMTEDFEVETDRGIMQGHAGDWLVTNHPDDDPGSDLWTVSAERVESTFSPCGGTRNLT